jgi:aspartate ammonia-lyase
MIDALDLLANAARAAVRCIATVTAHAEACGKYIDLSPTVMTAFVPVIGYEKTQDLIREYRALPCPRSVRDFLTERLDAALVDRILSPQNLTALGYTHDPEHDA